jgi:PBSX family phage terminase large subunit
LPVDYVSALEAEYAGTVWYNRYIMGEWTLAEGLIYPMYDTIIQPVPEGTPTRRILSVDYGTLNAFSAGLWGEYNGVWWREREYYYSGRDKGVQKTDEEYAQDLDKFTEGIGNTLYKLPVIIDPSAASFITLIRKKENSKYKIIPADNAVADGLRETATAMHKGLIRVDPCCKNWISEVQGYVWDDNEAEDRPIKINDHAMDDTRYFVKTMRVTKPKSNYQSIFMR